MSNNIIESLPDTKQLPWLLMLPFYRYQGLLDCKALRPTNRGRNIKAGKNYYMMFANPDRHVKSGGKVTLVVGDFKVEHLTVN